MSKAGCRHRVLFYDRRMPERRSPTLRRRRLSAELRNLRAQAGLTLVEVAKRLGWSEGKLRWIEAAQWVRPNVGDVMDLLDTYGVTDQRQREKLLRLAREAGQRGWWHPYRDMISERYSTYIGLEAEASALQTYQALVIPGLLQTDDYARALIQAGPAEITEEEVERRIAIRAKRQKILTGEDPARLSAVIDEAALRRPVGGADVMRAQLERLVQLARLPRVMVQLLPYSLGPHPGLGGPFTILSFPESDPDAAYVETIAGELLIEEDSDVERYRSVYRRLLGLALSPADTINMLALEAERV